MCRKLPPQPAGTSSGAPEEAVFSISRRCFPPISSPYAHQKRTTVAGTLPAFPYIRQSFSAAALAIP